MALNTFTGRVLSQDPPRQPWPVIVTGPLPVAPISCQHSSHQHKQQQQQHLAGCRQTRLSLLQPLQQTAQLHLSRLVRTVSGSRSWNPGQTRLLQQQQQRRPHRQQSPAKLQLVCQWLWEQATQGQEAWGPLQRQQPQRQAPRSLQLLARL